MARRREVNREKLSEADLVALRERLAAMSLNELERHYQASHNACRFACAGPLKYRCVSLVKG